jgi:hypothetical protein
MLGVLRRALGAFGLWLIWSLEAVNFLVHVSLRPTPWNWLSTMIGYALWALQLASLFVFQALDPGTASAEWEEGARSGEFSSTVCKRTGKLLPARALFVRRAKGVVLGVDHFCGWTGTVVGLHNRKLFVLFVCYSAIFCAMGAAHSAYALWCSLPEQLADPGTNPAATATASAATAASTEWSRCRERLSLPPALHEAFARRSLGAIVWEGLAACHVSFAALLHMLGRARRAGHLVYAILLTGTVPVNLLAAVFLGSLAIEQLRLISRNRTTLDPKNSAYDLGLQRNWRQWFGQHALLWPLPVPATVGSDGYEWPLNPTHRVGEGVVGGPHPLSAQHTPGMRGRERQARRFVQGALGARV